MNKKLKILEKRGARGKKRNLLKKGKAHIKSMDIKALFYLYNNIALYTKGRHFGASGNKHYKKIARIVSLIVKEGKVERKYIYKKNDLLKSFYPKRSEQTWASYNDRKGAKLGALDLSKFSFIDSPINTMRLLQELIKLESKKADIKLNFLDDYCWDIGPYLVLGILKQYMLPLFSGGIISDSVGGAIYAVQLDKLLNMRIHDINDYKENIKPFKLRSRRQSGSSTKDNLPTSLTKEDKTCSDFVDTLNDWLSHLPQPRKLVDSVEVEIGYMLGEVLDNAKRHSHISEDGQWHICGLMQRIYVEKNKENLYMCNVSIISFGMTFYDSLQSATDTIKEQIKQYVQRHKKNFNEEMLWTLSALQDGISRDQSADSGKGFISALGSLFSTLFNTESEEHKPSLTVISGATCIILKYPYNEATGKHGRRCIALNSENDLAFPPDTNHIMNLPMKFPGTAISIRFFLDQKHLH